MKTYIITVNGKIYAVTVGEDAAAGVAPVVIVPVAAPASVTASAVAPASAAVPVGAVGSVQMVVPMPGKVVTAKSAVGQAVKKSDVIPVLEAMKMKNDIVAPQDGIIASISVSTGNSVESGAVSATLN